MLIIQTAKVIRTWSDGKWCEATIFHHAKYVLPALDFGAGGGELHRDLMLLGDVRHAL